MPRPTYRPAQIGIELVRGCNFSCVMCPVTSNAPFEEHKFRFIDLGLLRDLVAEIERWPTIRQIWFFHFGEPMAHPKYRECLSILHSSSVARNAFVVQHTNGSLLRGDKAEAILDIPILNKLVFSFDGFGDKASFEALRGPHYDVVLANIRAFTEQARKRRPDLQLATCTILPRDGELPLLPMADNPTREQALTTLHSIFDPLGVAVEVRDMHDYSGNDDLPVSGRMPLKVYGGCSFVEQDSLYFTVDGQAQPCCAVYDVAFNVGRFGPDGGFAELLNNEHMASVRHHLRMDERTAIKHCANCKLSLGGYTDPQYLTSFWRERDDLGLLEDPQERQYLFNVVAPTQHRAVRVELGESAERQTGFVGVPTADLNGRLPFDDDSVDLIYAGPALAQVRDLEAVLREVYRVCKPGAQVVFAVPYGPQGADRNAPRGAPGFSEHTPRSWTGAAECLLAPDEFGGVAPSPWGLLPSNAEGSVDLRCVRVEFFYSANYRGLDPVEQRQVRDRYPDACELIVYHLLAAKGAMGPAQIKGLIDSMTYSEPGYVTARRTEAAPTPPPSQPDCDTTEMAQHTEATAALRKEGKMFMPPRDELRRHPTLQRLIRHTSRRVEYAYAWLRWRLAPTEGSRQRRARRLHRLERREG